MPLIQKIFSRPNQLTRAIFNQPITRSAGIYAGATASVKLVALIKEAAVAAIFGVSGAIDIYLMALMLIVAPIGLLLNAVQTASIPLLIEIKQIRGLAARNAFFYSVVRITLLIMALTLLIWLALTSWFLDIVGHGFDDEKRAAVRSLMFWLIPYYFFSGLSLLAYGALQAEKRFLHSALLPVFVPLATLLLLVAMGNSWQDVRLLVAGLVLGSFLECVVLYGYLRSHGFTSGPAAAGTTTDLRRLGKSASLLAGGTVTLAFVPMIEQAIASGVGDGAIAAIGYAFKLPAMVNSILVTAVGVTVLPFFSEMLARKDYAVCRRAFTRYVFLLLVMGGALAVLLIYFSHPIVGIMFQRGAFGAADTRWVTEIQQAYLLQIPGALISMLAVRLLVAQAAYGVLSMVSVLSVMLSAVLAWSFVAKFGATGIAFGSSMTTTIVALLLFGIALRRIHILEKRA